MQNFNGIDKCIKLRNENKISFIHPVVATLKKKKRRRRKSKSMRSMSRRRRRGRRRKRRSTSERLEPRVRR